MLARHHWITIAIALLGMLASASLAWLQQDIIAMQREAAIQAQIRSQWDRFRVEIKRAEDLQDTVVAFFEAAQKVDHAQFEAFAASLPSVNFQVISFAAYVPHAKRVELERSTPAGGEPASRIWERDADGRPIAAAERDGYLPVTYMYPEARNLPALGFDLLSEPRRRRAALLAIQTGRTVRSDPIRLVQDPEQWAFLVYKPVYARHKRDAAGDAGQPELVGIVSAAYEFGTLLETAVRQGEVKAQQIALFDTTEPSFPVFVHSSGTPGHDRPELERPLPAVAALPGAHLMTVPAMQGELSAVFFVDEASATWWRGGNANVLITIVIGLLLTATLVWNHVRSYRLAIRLGKATEDGRARKEEAERASVAKSRVLAYASHDLRQPLHALELFVAHLKEQPLEYGTAKIVDNVDHCIDALTDLLNALLDLSQLESGSIRPVFQPVPVEELWTYLRDVFAETAAAKGIELRFRPSPLWLVTDPQLLRRILLNLVSNAIRYTSKGGVLVGCRRAGGRARLEVWDTGVGIAREDRDEVFKEFVQLDHPDGHPRNGLGLGLSIVERTAELLNHRLGMRSVPERGSCFSLELSIADPVASAFASSETPEPRDGDTFAGLRVLVVEDDALARRALVDLLRSWRCNVTETGSAQDAEQAVADGCRPDVIVSDLRLPNRQSGIDLIARIRATLGYEIAACVISGDVSSDTVSAANAARLLLLHKPVKAPRLRKMLYLLLGSRLAPRE